MIVLSIATDRNKYVIEFEKSLRRLGYRYELLGVGEKWEGFTTKMKLGMKKLLSLPPEEIVIMCDSYDIIFVQSPDTIMERYSTLAEGKVVIGLENITAGFCNFSPICDSSVIKTCKIHNTAYPNFKYINSGFMMGPAKYIYDVYKFMMENKMKDDQLGLFHWVERNCNKCYFDYHLDFVFNYFVNSFINNSVRVDLDPKTKTVWVNRRSTPSCVHIPAHYLDMGHRSEKIRNFMFPDRTPVKKIEYVTEFYGKTCKPEFGYLGYWWFILLILIVLLITMSIYAYK